MKNTILMMSKIKVGSTLLTSILVISILGILLLLILNRNQKLKSLKKMTSVALILTMLLLPFSNLLNVEAEETIINVDDNKKVVDTTGLIVKVSDDNTDIFKAYKVLDAYYDSSTNVMSYNFTPEFSNFLKSSGDSKLSSLTIDDYIAYGNINSNLSSEEKSSIQKEYNNMIEKFAKYIKKGTNTLPKTYELTNNVGVSKTATVEIGSYLILPAVLANNPYISDDALNYNYYGALIANAIYKVENGVWTKSDCEVSSKDTSNTAMSVLVNVNIDNFDMEKLSDNNIGIDMDFYSNKEYLLLIMISQNDIYDDSNKKLQITLPSGLVLADKTDLNNIYNIFESGSAPIQTTSDGKLLDKANADGIQAVAATVSVEELSLDDGTSTKVINIMPTSAISDTMMLAVRVKLNSDKEKLVFGLNGNVIKTDFTFTVDPYTDPVTTKTINLENKALTYGLQISNKSQSDNSYLSGAIFGIYTDASCSEVTKVGELNIDESIDSETFGRYAGLPSGTYYVKQLKASTGYKLSTDIASITIDSSNNGYLKLEVTNTKMGFLPSTGGLGTILYTTFGLLIIAVGSITFISYRKKQLQNN